MIKRKRVLAIAVIAAMKIEDVPFSHVPFQIPHPLQHLCFRMQWYRDDRDGVHVSGIYQNVASPEEFLIRRAAKSKSFVHENTLERTRTFRTKHLRVAMN